MIIICHVFGIKITFSPTYNSSVVIGQKELNAHEYIAVVDKQFIKHVRLDIKDPKRPNSAVLGKIFGETRCRAHLYILIWIVFKK